jgi:pyridoxine kinase
MNHQKRVAAIHDISGFGKCSLTVALPIISAAGIEVAVMPTAVLSTHTGGFEGYTYRDLTGDMRPIAKHWKSLGIEFDAVYSGFLGSFEQIAIVKEFIDSFRREGTVVLVDPAMADNGKMYPVFDMDFAKEMAGLCAKADIIVPNMTEAAFLLGEEYIERPYTKEYIEGLLHKLSGLGPSKAVLTGVMFDEDKLGAAAYDKMTGKISYAFSETIAGNFHGTGDIFASAMLAAYLNGKSIAQAAQIAVDFTCASIQRTKDAGTDVRFGVNFEAGLPELMKVILA